MAAPRRLYLVVLLLVVALAAAGAYWRYRVVQAKKAAECDTPAEAKPVTPPPKLPDFALEAGCAPGAEPAKAGTPRK